MLIVCSFQLIYVKTRSSINSFILNTVKHSLMLLYCYDLKLHQSGVIYNWGHETGVIL